MFPTLKRKRVVSELAEAADASGRSFVIGCPPNTADHQRAARHD